jgi:hypothetical protein
MDGWRQQLARRLSGKSGFAAEPAASERAQVPDRSEGRSGPVPAFLKGGTTEPFAPEPVQVPDRSESRSGPVPAFLTGGTTEPVAPEPVQVPDRSESRSGPVPAFLKGGTTEPFAPESVQVPDRSESRSGPVPAFLKGGTTEPLAPESVQFPDRSEGRSGPVPLEALRARVAEVAAECDRKYAEAGFPWAPATRRAIRGQIEEALSGQEVETAFGRHFETEKLYAGHRHHGSSDIGALSDLPHDLLGTLSGGTIPAARPEEWAFLDTETTGLAGGSAGSCAFLVGVGRITREGFRVRQFFMRDHGEEASVLDALARHLDAFRVMITYNGRAFDQPLLEARYRWNRAGSPFVRMEHLDLLHGARWLWKLRFESCRLVDLESRVLGVDRDGDIPGALIPYVYFEYLRTRQALRLLPVFEHNAIDILTLACLTGIVPAAFQDPASAKLRHGSEMAGLARWLYAAGDLEGARALMRRAIDTTMGNQTKARMPDELLFRSMWELAQLERKLEARDAALAIWEDLASGFNPFQVRAIEEMAKHYEHRAKDRKKALEWTRAARRIEDSPELARREARLSREPRRSKARL